jgi:HD-like signal output (HDOD) protein
MCAKVLQLVNSSFLGLGRRISSMRQSVSYLGATTLRRLIHSPEVFRTFGNASEVHGFSLDGLRNHSLVTARLAQHIVESSPEARAQSATTDSCGQSAERSTLAEDAFAAGMLHDVGLLVLAAHEPERLALALDHAKRNGGPISVAETTFFGATHAETGACLLGLWGLPCSVVQAVANHHHPTRAPNANSILVDAVHIANVLATEACHWLESDLDARIPDPASIDRIGSPALLAEWQQIAARLVRKVSASPVPECA